MHPKVVEYEREKPLPDVEDIKPASNQADARSISAMVLLRTCSANDFTDVSGYWVSRLMDAPGNIFVEKLTRHYFISFGTSGDAGMGWEVTPFGPNDEFFLLSNQNPQPNKRETSVRLQFFCTSSVWYPSLGENEEEYAGVPTEICYVVWPVYFL